MSAPTIIGGVFGSGRGGGSCLLRRLSRAEYYVPRKHGWNLAQGQMGILLTRGWNVFFVGGSVTC